MNSPIKNEPHIELSHVIVIHPSKYTAYKGHAEGGDLQPDSGSSSTFEGLHMRVSYARCKRSSPLWGLHDAASAFPCLIYAHMPRRPSFTSVCAPAADCGELRERHISVFPSPSLHLCVEKQSALARTVNQPLQLSDISTSTPTSTYSFLLRSLQLHPL